MIACPYQDLFLYIIDIIHQKWNAEWNEKNDKLKEIKLDNQPWKENERCRKDENFINRLRAGHTLLTHGHLMEGLHVPPERELCHNHTMSVKHLLTECANLDSLRLRFFDCSNPITLKRILGRNKVNSSTVEILKESGIYKRAYKRRKKLLISYRP